MWSTLVLAGLAVVATLAVVFVHVVLVVRVFKHAKKMVFIYLGLLIVTGALWAIASTRVAGVLFSDEPEPENKAGIQEFEDQIKQLDDAENIQLNLSTNR